MGAMRSYAQKLNLNLMVPHNELSSTTYCLANPAVTGGQYLVYSPWGGYITVDLTTSKGTMSCEWYFPKMNAHVAAGTVQGGAKRTFTSASGQDAVLSITADTPLPVELSGVSALIEGHHVRLAWRTATEVNNYGFDIERRLPARAEWTTTGFVEGAGTSSSPHEYSFTDEIPGDSAVYRLKQIDRDGACSYSREILLGAASVPTVCALSSNYPNPFNPSTNIDYSVASAGPVTLVVTDLLGREIAVLVNETKEPGKYTAHWDAQNVPSGLYFSTLSAGKFKATAKMLLQK
jgi:hypothetical protein